jgi:ketosteroid isomerase-like protein
LDPDYGIKPLQVKEVVALEDGRIMVHCKSDGRGKNGVPYANEYCWIIEVSNGKLTSMREFADTALIERAMFNKEIIPEEQIRNR